MWSGNSFGGGSKHVEINPPGYSKLSFGTSPHKCSFLSSIFHWAKFFSFTLIPVIPIHHMKPTKRKPHNQSSRPLSPRQPDIVDLENSEVRQDSPGPTDFIFSEGLTSDEASAAMVAFGRNELPEKKVSKLYIFLSLLLEPMPVMIWVAILIEALISKWMDMSILLAIQFSIDRADRRCDQFWPGC